MGTQVSAQLTADRVRELLHYAPETGEFTWRVSRRCVPAGTQAGSVHKGKGYRNIRVDLRLHSAHRLAWLYVHGCWPRFEIDHLDGDRLNNAITNLRDVPHRMNAENKRRAAAHNRCGKLGVRQRSVTRWESSITADGVSHYIGSFGDPDTAHSAYLSAKRSLHPGSTV